MPREPPVTSATFLLNLDTGSPLVSKAACDGNHSIDDCAEPMS
jgi:hypothetical protein